MSYEKRVMVCLLVLKGLLNKAYYETIENVNKIADNSLQKHFKHKLAHSCTYILVDICED